MTENLWHRQFTKERLHESYHFVQSDDPEITNPDILVAAMNWLDTTSEPYLPKRRNDTNDGWINIGVSSAYPPGITSIVTTVGTPGTDDALPTEQGVREAIDAAVATAVKLQGVTDCSGNPNYPSATAGFAWYVSVAGKIGGSSGKSVDIGDLYICRVTNGGGTEASVGSDWFVMEHNLINALLASNNLSDLTNFITARFNLGVEATQVDVASGTTTNIGAAASMSVRVTGTVTIVGFDNVAAGIWRVGYFSGALTLTHNSTSLILPSGANILTAAGDSFIARSLGSGNWKVMFYEKADGTPIVGGGGSGAFEDLTTIETDATKVAGPDGVGGVLWKDAAGAQVLNVNTTPVGNVGAGEDDLITYTVPANTLDTDNQYIHFKMAGIFASSINNKRIRVKLGSTTLFDTGALAITTAGDWSIEGDIVRTGSATQRCRIEFTSSQTALSGDAQYTDATEDLTTNLVLKATGEATSNNDVVEKFAVVEKGGGVFTVSGGGGGGWTQVVNEDGSSFSNFTGVSGTWASDGTQIKQTDTGATPRRAKYINIVEQSLLIYEAQIQIRSSGAARVGGLLIGFDGTTSSGPITVILDEGNDVIKVSVDGVVDLLSISTTIAVNTLYTLRVAYSGQSISVYLDGTLKGVARNNNGGSMASASYIGLNSYQAEVWWKNIKAWILTQP